MPPFSTLLQRLAFPLLLIAITVAVFWQVTTFGIVQYDDPALISENAYVNQGITKAGIKWAFFYHDSGAALRAGTENLWHPLTWISHMLDFELWENRFGFHHLTNLLLHVGSTLFLYLIVQQLLRSKLQGLIVAALFAIHPMHVESVAWLSDRKGLLSAFFCLLSLYLYLLNRYKRSTFRILSVVFFICALLAKPSVVVLPGLLVLIDWLEKRKQQPTDIRAWLLFHLRDKWPWFVPAVAIAAITILAQGSGTHDVSAGQMGRLFAMPANFLTYIFKCFYPHSLAFHYPVSSYARSSIGGLIAWTLLINALIWIWNKRHTQRHLFFGFCWVLLCWFPVSGLVYVGTSFTADRYSYLMYIGAFIAFSLSLSQLFGDRKHIASALAILCIPPLSWLSYKQVSVWKDTESLFSHAYKHYPNDTTTLINYATMLEKNGNALEAITIYEQARTIDPNDPAIWYNLAVCYASSGNTNEAISVAEKAVELQPRYAPTWYLLGQLYGKEGKTYDLTKATAAMQHACEKTQFRDPRAILILAQYYAKSGDANALHELVEKTRSLKVADSNMQANLEKMRAQFGR